MPANATPYLKKAAEYSEHLSNLLRQLFHDYSKSFEESSAVFGEQVGADDAAAFARESGLTGMALVAIEELYTNLFWAVESIEEAKTQNIANGQKGKNISDKFGVTVAFQNGYFLVVTPPLSSKWASSKRRDFVLENGKAHKISTRTYSKIFALSIAKEMETIVSQIPKDDLLLFKQKKLLYYFVYPTTAKNIPDTDNIDTKAVTDAITFLLPGGDESCSCEFQYIGKITDQLNPGCYIITMPKSHKLINSPDEIFNIILSQQTQK